ncbi:MAG: hypothetical protein ACRCYS_12660, partial [Beijerinckiaceae bacterium]
MRARTRIAEVAENFPIFPRGDLDFHFPNSGWKLLIESKAPSELKRRIAGAFISFNLGNKSVDYILKKYLNHIEYPEVTERLDLQCESLILGFFASASELVRAATYLPLSDQVQTTSANLIRISFSSEVAVHAAHRGGLFECATIMRMILEQL